jgi:hypothetical protein
MGCFYNHSKYIFSGNGKICDTSHSQISDEMRIEKYAANVSFHNPESESRTRDLKLT